MGSVHYTGLLIGICFVVLIQFASGKGNVTLNGQCTDSNNCTTANSNCSTTKTCLCAAGYFSPSSNKTRCFSKIAVNKTCDAKDSKPCVDEHAKCSYNHGYSCLCSDTYYHKGNICEPRIEVNGTCTNVQNECIQNAACDKNHKCQCKVGYPYKNKSCSGVSKIFIELSTMILAMLALRCNKWFVE